MSGITGLVKLAGLCGLVKVASELSDAEAEVKRLDAKKGGFNVALDTHVNGDQTANNYNAKRLHIISERDKVEKEWSAAKDKYHEIKKRNASGGYGSIGKNRGGRATRSKQSKGGSNQPSLNLGGKKDSPTPRSYGGLGGTAGKATTHKSTTEKGLTSIGSNKKATSPKNVGLSGLGTATPASSGAYSGRTPAEKSFKDKAVSFINPYLKKVNMGIRTKSGYDSFGRGVHKPGFFQKNKTALIGLGAVGAGVAGYSALDSAIDRLNAGTDLGKSAGVTADGLKSAKENRAYLREKGANAFRESVDDIANYDGAELDRRTNERVERVKRERGNTAKDLIARRGKHREQLKKIDLMNNLEVDNAFKGSNALSEANKTLYMRTPYSLGRSKTDKFRDFFGVGNKFDPKTYNRTIERPRMSNPNFISALMNTNTGYGDQDYSKSIVKRMEGLTEKGLSKYKEDSLSHLKDKRAVSIRNADQAKRLKRTKFGLAGLGLAGLGLAGAKAYSMSRNGGLNKESEDKNATQSKKDKDGISLGAGSGAVGGAVALGAIKGKEAIGSHRKDMEQMRGESFHEKKYLLRMRDAFFPEEKGNHSRNWKKNNMKANTHHGIRGVIMGAGYGAAAGAAAGGLKNALSSKSGLEKESGMKGHESFFIPGKGSGAKEGKSKPSTKTSPFNMNDIKTKKQLGLRLK